MTLSEAKQELNQLDNTIAGLIKKAYREYYVTLELMIVRYQAQMRQLLRLYEPKLIVSFGDKERTKQLLIHFASDLKRIAEPTLTAAANVGFERCLMDLKLRGLVTEYPKPVIAPSSYAAFAIKQNTDYIDTSLIPDMIERLTKVQALGNMPQAIASFNSRLNLYGHWCWRTSERSYIKGLAEFQSFRRSRKELRA